MSYPEPPAKSLFDPIVPSGCKYNMAKSSELGRKNLKLLLRGILLLFVGMECAVAQPRIPGVAVPFAEAINPISHTSWEGTGVLPDVKVPAADALATAEQLATRDIQAASANPHPRFVQQLTRSTPSPGTEASLRRQIEGWEERQPDYKDLGLGLEEFAFQQRARLQAIITRLGALKSLTFVRVGRDGSDIYDARFAHGRLQWRVSPLSSDGRVPGEFFSPLTGNGVRSPPP
jgi:hypothetical protein